MRLYDGVMEARGPDITGLPGADLVERGIADLEAGGWSVEAALVSMAAPRLRTAGIAVPPTSKRHPSHELYALLAGEDEDSAHARYNALVGRTASFARALEHARSG